MEPRVPIEERRNRIRRWLRLTNLEHVIRSYDQGVVKCKSRIQPRDIRFASLTHRVGSSFNQRRLPHHAGCAVNMLVNRLSEQPRSEALAGDSLCAAPHRRSLQSLCAVDARVFAVQLASRTRAVIVAV